MKVLLSAVLSAAVLLCGCGPAPRPVDEVSVTTDELVPAASISVTENDWPWWRGVNRNNTATCTAAPVEWSESKNVVWKTAIEGRGHSTPTVVGEHIFLTTADESAQKQFVVCFNRTTGRHLWQTEIHSGNLPGRGSMHPKSTHANCTVACDGQSLFVAFLNGENVTATSLTLDGKIRWQTDLGFFVAKFGYAPSPGLLDSFAIFAADNRGGGFITAVHRDTGKIVWKKARNNVDSYSSAVVAEIDGANQLLISGDNRVAAYDPLTGSELWSCSGTAEATCGTPVWYENLVFASGGYPERETIGIDARTGSRVWDDSVKCYEQSMLIAGDHLYGVTDDGIAICWEARTGNRKWRQRLSGPISASPVLVGSRIYATNEAGTTWVFEADPSGYKQIAKNQLGNEAFASLAVCGEKIFARVASGSGADRQEYLYCIADTAIDTAD